MRTAHPNATAAGGTGGVALLAVWLAGHFGINLSAEEGAGLSGALSVIVLAVGRDGVAGLARRLWRGGH